MKLIILFFQTILSLLTTNNELLRKLKAYQVLTGVNDDLMMQYVEKVSRKNCNGLKLSFCFGLNYIDDNISNLSSTYLSPTFAANITKPTSFRQMISKIIVETLFRNFDMSQIKTSSLVNIFTTKLKNWRRSC